MTRHDYLPYGEELQAGGRTAARGYAADSVKQKFTGYERDAETNLNFAEARYHSDTQGRFTSIDPLSSSAKLTDPQSLNRYSYVGNNPVVFSDPSGMDKTHMSMPSDERGQTVQGLHDEGSFVLAADEYAYESRLARTLAGLDQATDTATEEAQEQQESASRPANRIRPIDPCPITGFTNDIGSYSAEELNDAVITVFGELSSTVTSDSQEEALAVASEIRNRSDAIANGTAEKSWGDSPSFTSVVTARAQFNGYEQGIAVANQNVDFKNGGRNCTRLTLAVFAVGLVAEKGAPYSFTYNFANYTSTKYPRPLGDGEVRINGNDFSSKPMKFYKPPKN
jgi:RHS repeat-associated protein